MTRPPWRVFSFGDTPLPYNGSGSFSVVNTFVPNTTISSTAMNANFSDMATNGFSAVLTRDGQSVMTGQFKAANGTELAPSITFGTDLNCGIYRIAADNIGVACNGAKVVDISTTGVAVTGNISATGRVSENGAILLPAGVILPYGGSSAPSGYLLCYGQAVSRTTYATLFAAIGTAYGVGDGTTTFNVPDLRGRVPAGKDDMGGSAASRLTSTTMSPDGNTLAATGGTQTHTLTAAESATLTYTVTDPGHVHSGLRNNGVATNSQQRSAYAAGAGGALRFNGSDPNEVSTTSATTGISVSSNASDDPHLNVQPSIITNYIIKH
jgi:microcystin-dependent protein